MPLFGQMFSHLARSILIMVMRPFLCLSEEVSFGGWSIVQATLSLSTQQESCSCIWWIFTSGHFGFESRWVLMELDVKHLGHCFDQNVPQKESDTWTTRFPWFGLNSPRSQTGTTFLQHSLILITERIYHQKCNVQKNAYFLTLKEVKSCSAWRLCMEKRDDVSSLD